MQVGLRDTDSIPGLGRSPGRGHGSPLQYSCLENPMDRGAWQAAVYRVTKSWTWLKRLGTHAPITYNGKESEKGYVCMYFKNWLLPEMYRDRKQIRRCLGQSELVEKGSDYWWVVGLVRVMKMPSIWTWWCVHKSVDVLKNSELCTLNRSVI